MKLPTKSNTTLLVPPKITDIVRTKLGLSTSRSSTASDQHLEFKNVKQNKIIEQHLKELLVDAFKIYTKVVKFDELDDEAFFKAAMELAHIGFVVDSDIVSSIQNGTASSKNCLLVQKKDFSVYMKAWRCERGKTFEKYITYRLTELNKYAQNGQSRKGAGLNDPLRLQKLGHGKSRGRGSKKTTVAASASIATSSSSSSNLNSAVAAAVVQVTASSFQVQNKLLIAEVLKLKSDKSRLLSELDTTNKELEAQKQKKMASNRSFAKTLEQKSSEIRSLKQALALSRKRNSDSNQSSKTSTNTTTTKPAVRATNSKASSSSSSTCSSSSDSNQQSSTTKDKNKKKSKPAAAAKKKSAASTNKKKRKKVQQSAPVLPQRPNKRARTGATYTGLKQVGKNRIYIDIHTFFWMVDRGAKFPKDIDLNSFKFQETTKKNGVLTKTRYFHLENSVQDAVKAEFKETTGDDWKPVMMSDDDE